MAKKKESLKARAWGLLRLALLWARKGGAFRRGILSGGNLLRGLRAGGSSRLEDGYHIRVGDKELSFGDTPVFRVGGRPSWRPSGSMRLLICSIPCVNPPAPVDLEFNDDEHVGISGEALFRRSSSEIKDNESVDQDFVSAELVEGTHDMMPLEGEDNGVDARADEFIARFYQQMKLQRQVSLLQYYEMLNRGV